MDPDLDPNVLESNSANPNPNPKLKWVQNKYFDTILMIRSGSSKGTYVTMATPNQTLINQQDRFRLVWWVVGCSGTDFVWLGLKLVHRLHPYSKKKKKWN